MSQQRVRTRRARPRRAPPSPPAAPGPPAPSPLVSALVDHVAELQRANRELARDLHLARAELHLLRRADNGGAALGTGGGPHAPPPPPAYSPGALVDLVREIRDASKVREEALYDQVRSLIDEKIYNKINRNSIDDEISSVRENMHQSRMLQTNLIDKVRTNERLSKLEDELQNLRVNQSRESHSPCSFSGTGFGGPGSPCVDQERIRLQMELNKERLAHSAAEARIHKLELMVTQMRAKKPGNGASASYTPVTTPVHMNGGTPTDPRQVVFGPITDL